MKKKVWYGMVHVNGHTKKVLFIMKLTFLAFFIGLMSLSASTYSQATKLSLKMKDASIIEIFEQIESQSEFVFIYKKDVIDSNDKFDLIANNSSVEEILTDIFQGTGIKFEIDDRQIIITKDEITPHRKPLNPSNEEVAYPQKKEISGTVKDLRSLPLPGVTVLVPGTTVGTVTDVDGKFSLSIPPDAETLQFSFVGMKTREILIGGQQVINIVMEEDVVGIEEVVAIGYGTQLRREVTSSIATVTEESFNKGAITQSPLQLVQGKIAGLAISRANGGDPTAEVQMQLRGVATVSGDASPLVIIDGVPGGNMNTLAPEDITSIDILRDGSAAAIYGTRGNAGVIIITTNKGTPGRPSINYSSYVYTETWLNKPDMLDAAAWNQARETFTNSGVDILESKAVSMTDYGYDTDWFDEITRNMPLSTVHNLSISGGDERTSYYGSINYRDLQGFIIESDNNILNGRLTVTHMGIDEKLKVTMSLSNTIRKSNPVNYNCYRQALQRNPTLPVFNEDGSFNEVAGYDTYNPVALLKQYDRENKNNSLLANTQISYEIISGLTFSATGALQRSNTITGYYESRDAFDSLNGGYNGEAQRTASQASDRTLETMVTYQKVFKGKHSLNALAGYSYQDFKYEGFGAQNRDFITDIFSFNNLGAGMQLPDGKYSEGDVFSSKESNKLIAFFGRINYNYEGTYMLSASLRREGSTRFGANDKWGLFPSISAGWTVSNEGFMKSVGFVDNLKLRIGYGVTGNQGIDNYLALERLGTSGVMLYNGAWIPGYAPASNPNPDLRWEKKAETNIGIDATLFNNAITLNIDLYSRKTRDLLYEYAVPVPPNLYSSIWTNIGELSNKGIEFALKSSPVKTNKFKWDVDFNISYNKNKLVSLSNEKFQSTYVDLENIGAPGLNSTPAFRLEQGQPIGNFYGYMFAGFTDEGKWLFWNKERTEKLLSSEVTWEDKGILGNGLPKSYAGLTNTFSYGNFDLTVFFRGAFGFKLLNTQRIFFENRIMLPTNVMTSALNSQVLEDPMYSDYYIEDGSYVKLDNVTIGYNIPVNGNLFKKLRVYASGQSLFTITGYKGQDPEIAINGLTPGMDYRWIYPSVRTFTLGVNVQF
jgi:TonB-linked SusC/RagA family outer membrane protein